MRVKEWFFECGEVVWSGGVFWEVVGGRLWFLDGVGGWGWGWGRVRILGVV